MNTSMITSRSIHIMKPSENSENLSIYQSINLSISQSVTWEQCHADKTRGLLREVLVMMMMCVCVWCVCVCCEGPQRHSHPIGHGVSNCGDPSDASSNQSSNQSYNQSSNQSSNQSYNQSCSESSNHSCSEKSNQPCSAPVMQPACLPISLVISHAASLPTD